MCGSMLCIECRFGSWVQEVRLETLKNIGGERRTVKLVLSFSNHSDRESAFVQLSCVPYVGYPWYFFSFLFVHFKSFYVFILFVTVCCPGEKTAVSGASSAA